MWGIRSGINPGAGSNHHQDYPEPVAEGSVERQHDSPAGKFARSPDNHPRPYQEALNRADDQPQLVGLRQSPLRNKNDSLREFRRTLHLRVWPPERRVTGSGENDVEGGSEDLDEFGTCNSNAGVLERTRQDDRGT